MRRAVSRVFAWIDADGSTRPAALMRIGLALILMVRFADQMMFRRHVDLLGAAIITVFWLGSLAMLLGMFSQVSSLVLAAVLTYASERYGAAEPMWHHHHVRLLITSVACIGLSPCGRSYSLDRWRALLRGTAGPERGPLWAVKLVAIQLSAVYFWGAIQKCTGAWMSGDRFEAQLLLFIFDSDPPAIPGWHLMVQLFAIGTVVLELALAVGLWWPRAQRWLIPAGIGFHLIIYVTLPVTVFSVLSCLLYLAYLDADSVHRAIDRLQSMS